MDLRSGQAFWPLQSGLMHTYPPLTQGERADVLVIGAGITGALLADALSAAGLDTVVLDRRDVATGSTSASTALLQYEIDTNLVDLIPMIGQRHAERAYQLCRESIDMIRHVTATLPDDCGFKERGSLYYASTRRDARMLAREHTAREAAGLTVELLDHRELRDRFGIGAPNALYSPDGAEVDPYRLAQHLLWRARDRGARVYDRTTVTRLDEHRTEFTAHTDRGLTVTARYVIVATGYEAETFLGRRLAQLKNSYALATEPVGREPWPTGCLIWETARPYLYARTTADGRIVMGGEDDSFNSPLRREKALAGKQRRLERKLEKLLPDLELEVAFAWAGTFGETKDGLAYIGPKEAGSRLLFALGYGGNGITYSAQAARLLTAYVQGRTDADLEIFDLNR
ncbi:glycine/D-amino acid oxidase-like deaminating enzyme [Deinococcus metalli]|uniref:Glycine/D-amino acid oxidase-like deaminating enzyme n=1 Tax=Deinococcus metalli TaxID=1141878 RepID=A0A7W8KEH7_9DEIO|nr:FAD-dependent oxidoreductase [Deinococcus metalli]MBB5376712.1 glycine/D-amino acid oxidase-like deaminating enzyme [Deinococcus metalli]GHF44778.1 oxidoreductase [Deinococcus metalli]